MRKTIRVEKYPFPWGADPAATFLIEAGDKMEATLCLKFRTFAYNLGFGNLFYMTTRPVHKNLFWEFPKYPGRFMLHFDI